MGLRIENRTVVTLTEFLGAVPASGAAPGTSTGYALPGGRVPHQVDVHPIVLSGGSLNF